MKMRTVDSGIVLVALILAVGLFTGGEGGNGSDRVRSVAEHAASGDFLAAAHAHIAAREYWASQADSGLQAPNRKQNLRSYFEPTGVRVHDRTAAGEATLVELRLSAIGRAELLRPVAAGEVQHDENRVEIRREGLVEWFENTEDGLEQGFTLSAPPASPSRATSSGELVLELAVERAQAALFGDSVALTTETGRKLSYGKLSVFDAKGRLLAARFEVPAADRIRLVVNDVSAAYPIVIDPLLAGTADAQIESNQISARLGNSVASAGDVNGDGFSDVIIGADAFDGGESFEGAAFVFLGSFGGVLAGNPVNAHAQLESNQISARLGSSVASAGDVNGDGYSDVIVGAPRYENSGLESAEGAAFIFLGSASGIADGSPATAHAQLESNVEGGFLGSSVASAGDVNRDGFGDVILGAPGFAPPSFRGAAFVFHGSASGIPSGNPATAATVLEGDQDGSEFGTSVSSAGDVNGDGFGDVIIGAVDFANGHLREGGAFVYLGASNGIPDTTSTNAHARFESNQSSAALGISVASAGDVNGDGYGDVIVGAFSYTAGLLASDVGEGAAFVFLGSSTGLTSGNPLTADAQLEGNQGVSRFGRAVASAGDVNGDGYGDVIVGAPLFDAGQTNEGSAFVFTGSANGLADANPGTAYADIESDLTNAELGGSVAAAGDVNGDGYGDLITGADRYGAGQLNEGAAFVHHGAAKGIRSGNAVSIADSAFESDQSLVRPGNAVASAGDVNGDGFDDIIVGVRDYDGGANVGGGAAFVFLGTADPTAVVNSTAAHAVIESDDDQSNLGVSVASAGDVNGDGYGDVIIGASLYTSDQGDEGAAFVFLGSAAGIPSGNPSTAHARFEANQLLASMGFSVSSAGDVNGDGYGDVIIGAPRFNGLANDQGQAYVFLGSPAGLSSGNPGTAHAVIESNDVGDTVGISVASAGDVDGDGYGDVIVGAPSIGVGSSAGGRALIFRGSAAGIVGRTPATAASVVLDSINQLGISVDGAGDVNADGYGDVIITSVTRALVFHGSANGIASGDETSANSTLSQTAVFPGVQYASLDVAGAGDVDGDGFGDVIVGGADAISPVGLNQFANARGHVYLGSPSGVPSGAPAQFQAVVSDPGLIAFDSWMQVAAAGDFNGDGFGDLLVSGTTSPNAYLLLGNSEGRPTLASQRRGGGLGVRVQPWGRSENPTSFKVSLRANHPAGTGRVRLQVEACPNGIPFGTSSCTTTLSPAWITLAAATPDIDITTDLSGLTSGALYHWRARVLHAPLAGAIATNPTHGPWRRVGGRSLQADVRTVPEPGIAAGLAVGISLLVAARRRSPGDLGQRRDVARRTFKRTSRHRR